LQGRGRRGREFCETFPALGAGSKDFILLQIGANDIIRLTRLADFEHDLREVFRKAKKASKSVAALHSGNVGLAKIFPRPLSWYMTLRTRTFRDAYMRIAKEEGVTYVDLYRSSADDLLKPAEKYYAPDFLHLNPKGYQVWYGETRAAMQRDGISL